MITRSDGASGRRTHTLLSRAKDENTNKRKMMFNTADYSSHFIALINTLNVFI